MELLDKLSYCIETGKINKNSPYPPDMKGQDGAEEITQEILAKGISPSEILQKALIPAMERVGVKFRENKIFVPQVLMSAKAMHASMAYLKSYFKTGVIKRKGIFVIGTVAGDLHDIGKNLVSMIIEGNGWEVIDLGIDVKTEKFLEAICL